MDTAVKPVQTGRRALEGRIIAHSAKERFTRVLVLAVFAETFAGECALGVLQLIDLSLPALVGPGGGTEAD